MALLDIQALNAFYGKAQALHRVSLSVNAGGIVAVVGANGAGKSTLLDSIMGLVHHEGRLLFDGQSLSGRRTKAIVECGIGYAPERANLFPFMSVEDTLLVGAYTARASMAANLARVHQLFPILAERRHQETGTQSGGERQMVSLGRALMTNPRLLLVDEPTIGLAPKVCNDIADVLRRLNQENGLTILITEQNANFALTLAERLYVLETGRIRAHGRASELAEDEALQAAYFGH